MAEVHQQDIFNTAVLPLEYDILAFPDLHDFGAELKFLGPSRTLPGLFQFGECYVLLFPVSCISLFVKVY